jgi:hypothetical protein
VGVAVERGRRGVVQMFIFRHIVGVSRPRGTIPPSAIIPPHARTCAVNKLKLNIEELEVDSFEVPTEDGESRGTVRGQAATEADCSYTCGDPFSTLYYYYRRAMTNI